MKETIIYKDKHGEIELEVKKGKETVGSHRSKWLIWERCPYDKRTHQECFRDTI
jgi:hypothetical protein